MSNHYPHQEEIDALTDSLLAYVEEHGSTPMQAISAFVMQAEHALDTSSDDMHNYDDWFIISDLEEAVVLKNFAQQYQQKYRDNFPEGQARI